MSNQNYQMYNRLTFILDKNSVSSVSKETGIPYTTLYYYNKQERNLPSKYENALVQAYQRSVYAAYRELGYDVRTSQSRRYWNPEKVALTLGTDAEKIERYTLFNVMRIDPKKPKGLIEAMKSDYWRYYYEKIEASFKMRAEWKEKHPNEDGNYS
jgi:hypothetical protein